MRIKALLRPAFAASGGLFYNAVYRESLEGALVVICYHDVSNAPSEFSRLYDLNVTPDVFDYQIRFIKKNFNIISPEDLIKGDIPRRAALITFDDGFKSYFTNAVPILTRYDVPSLIFLNMAPIMGDVFWPGLISYLCEKKADFKDFAQRRVSPVMPSEELLFSSCTFDTVDEYCKDNMVPDAQVKEFIGRFADEDDLSRASLNRLVFYGNHLYAHEAAVNLSDQELWQSFSKNESFLKKYSNYCRMFSFPFGQPGVYYLLRQADFLLSQGVEAVFGSCGMINFDRKKIFSRIALTSFHSSALRMSFGIHHGTFMRRRRPDKVYNG